MKCLSKALGFGKERGRNCVNEAIGSKENVYPSAGTYGMQTVKEKKQPCLEMASSELSRVHMGWAGKLLR